MIAEALGIGPVALNRWLSRQWCPSRGRCCGRPSVVDESTRGKVRQCYIEHHRQWGPQVLVEWCRQEGLGNWSATTLAGVIEDLREPKEAPPVPVRYEVLVSNAVWSEDGTGFQQEGRKQELLVVQDEHSRRKLKWELVPGPATSGNVLHYLRWAFEKHGAPLVLKHDGDGIFHTPEVRALLEEYQVLDLTSPAGHPGYNGKQERSMRDIKSYERAMRKDGDKGSLGSRIRATMKDLNDDRPRPVLGGRTSRASYNAGLGQLPDRRLFRASVESKEQELLALATSRREANKAHRKAIEQTLWSYGLMSIEGKVSHDFLLEVGTK